VINGDTTTSVSEDPSDATTDVPVETGEASKDRCKDIEIDGTVLPAAIEERVRRVCQNLTAPGGATRFLRDLIDNVPGMMFFFLPAIALVMLVLYPFSRRYYVEHLLFFVHFHSFFFLIMTLTVLFSRLPRLLPGQEIFEGLLTTVVAIYVPVYLFIAMRRVYTQSRSLTALKYLVLGIAYAISLVFSFTIVALFTALQV